MSGQAQLLPLPLELSWRAVQRRLRQVLVWDALEGIGADPLRCPNCGACLSFESAGRRASCPRCPVRGCALDVVRLAIGTTFREAVRLLAPVAGLGPDEVLAAHSLHVVERRNEPRSARRELADRGRRWVAAAIASEDAADLLATMKADVEEALRDLARAPAARAFPPPAEPPPRGGP